MLSSSTSDSNRIVRLGLKDKFYLAFSVEHYLLVILPGNNLAPAPEQRLNSIINMMGTVVELRSIDAYKYDAQSNQHDGSQKSE